MRFPSFSDINRQPKSVTLSYHSEDTDDESHLLERKDTKRSDTNYYSHIEPATSASDSNHRHSFSTNNNKNNTQIYTLVNHNQTDRSLNVANENSKNIKNINNDNGYSHHNVSHNNNNNDNNSYEKLLKPQNVYIPNLPKVINTVSVSVSDQNGKKLNLSLENIFAEQYKQQQHRSYDDYKEDEISAALLEPFFLDVPKLNTRSSNHNNNNNNSSSTR